MKRTPLGSRITGALALIALHAGPVAFLATHLGAH